MKVVVGIFLNLRPGPKEVTKDDEKYLHAWVVALHRKLQKALRSDAFEMESEPASDKHRKITLNKVCISDGRRLSGNSISNGKGVTLQINSNGYKLSKPESGGNSLDGAYDNQSYQ